MKIAVTGASGYLGSHFVQSALDQGGQVSGLAFPDIPPDSPTRERLTWVRGSINDVGIVSQLLAGADVIVHLASFVHRQTVTAKDIELCRRTNVDGMQVVLNVAQEQPKPPFIIFMSTRAVYAPSEHMCDEQSLCRPITVYGQTKLEAEKILLEGIKNKTVRGCILRPSVIYGPGAPGNVLRLFGLIDRGIVPLINGGANQKSLVYIDNIVRIIWTCIQMDSVTNGNIYNISDMPLLTMRDVVERSAAHLDKSPIIISVPYWLAQGILGLHDRFLGKFRGKVYLPTLHAFAEPGAVTSQKLADATGYQQSVSIEDGLQRMAQWYRVAKARTE